MVGNQRVITMSNFNTKRFGRAGNQFLQYMFLKSYAATHQCQLQLPSWVGNQLFGTNDPPITVSLPSYREPVDAAANRQALPPTRDALVGHDFVGYAQYHTSVYHDLALSKNEVRGLLQPVASLRERLEPARQLLTREDRLVIGLHIRRGDYGRRHFSLTPSSWFLQWLNDHWWQYTQPDNPPVLFIATEDPTVVEEFAAYHPVTATALGVELNQEPMADYNYLPHDLETQEPGQLDWYPDFYLLSQCHVVVASNSTFSFVAAMLNPSLQELWRPSLPAASFVLADPWNDYPLLRHKVQDFNHLEDIAVKANPYWQSS